MLAGDFERAWRVNDRIRILVTHDPNRLWQGEDFANKRVMVRCLHGFGDAVQFLRYVPLLNTKAASVCVEVAPRLVELARCLDGVSEVITWGAAAPAVTPAWDVQMEVMELPYVFRTQREELPLAKNYLRVDGPGKQPRRKLHVGLAWTAGAWKPDRGLPLAALQFLLAMDGCDFWSLAATAADCEEAAGMHQDARSRDSVVGLAQRIATLDLVITVDTLAAHLAGAIGVPAYVMLRHEADWRWMSAGETSPWYPSLRLFRQREHEGWTEVVGRVAQSVGELAAEHARDRKASEAVA